MINVRLHGGLGNQMFQYALGRSLELRGRKVTYDAKGLSTDKAERPHNRNRPQYGLDGFSGTEVTFGGTVGQVYHGNVAYDNYAFTATGDLTLDGYWQSEKFFYIIKDTITREYEVNGDLFDYLRFDFTQDTTLLQVRRGDYVQFANFHNPLSASYYREGLDAVYSRQVAVFTDDADWVQNNADEIFQGRQWVFGNTGNRHWDITIMAMCDNAVIANSTFGWWGAWLGDQRKKNKDRRVIAPAQWFGPEAKLDTKDLVPERWIKL
jgi:hypothetical protein